MSDIQGESFIGCDNHVERCLRRTTAYDWDNEVGFVTWGTVWQCGNVVDDGPPSAAHWLSVPVSGDIANYLANHLANFRIGILPCWVVSGAMTRSSCVLAEKERQSGNARRSPKRNQRQRLLSCG